MTRNHFLEKQADCQYISRNSFPVMGDQSSYPEIPLSLKRLRERVGLSQDELARCIGVTSKTVSNWERGISLASLTVPQLKALCKALQVSLEELPDDFSADK